jgi:hypothetical protein
VFPGFIRGILVIFLEDKNNNLIIHLIIPDRGNDAPILKKRGVNGYLRLVISKNYRYDELNS